MAINPIDISNTNYLFQDFVATANVIIATVNSMQANTTLATAITNLDNTKAANSYVNSQVANLNSLIGGKLDTTTYTPSDILAKLLTVDGVASGIDSQYLAGENQAYYKNASNLDAGTVPSARLTGSYTGMSNISGLTTLGAVTVTANAVVANTVTANSYTGITKAMVGLSVVDNVSDVNKPISTAQLAGLTPRVANTTDNSVPRFDLTAGLLQTSGTTIDDTGQMRILATGTNYLRIGSTGANTAGRGLQFDSSTSAAIAYIETVPNVPGTSTAMNFYVGGGSVGDMALVLNDAGQTLHQDGTIAAPAMSFKGNTTTGFLIGPANSGMSVSVDGINQGSWGTQGIRVTHAAYGATSTFGSVDSAALIVNSGGSQVDVTNTTGGGSMRLSRAAGSTGIVESFHYGATNVGNVTVTASSTTFNSTSDYRAKFNVVPLVTFELDAEAFALLGPSLLRVMLLRPISHNWVNEPNGPATHGFIAHEAQVIVPHAVTGFKDQLEDIGTAAAPEGPLLNVTKQEAGDYKWKKTGTRPLLQTMDYGKLTADLTAAIQELTLLVLDQRREIDELKARLP